MTDVAIVVEGSFPDVTGGVSEWTHRLLAAMPDVSFAIAHLGAAEGKAAYALPANAHVVRIAPDASPDALPDASVYHALSTGTAGELALHASAARGRHMILSEHGLAWLEARLGIVGCKGPKGVVGDPALVAAQARAAYAGAFAVTSVCSWNARLQRGVGARNVRVIENPATAPTERNFDRDAHAPLIGFVGRVVPVKDVVTFLEACRLVADAIPHARFVVLGPLDQDEEYAARCRSVAEALRLDVEFTGEADPAPWYARLDALVLTSRSEAQPLVALEAMAASVPVVATDVGGCRELLAESGLVTPVATPRATANAVLRILGDDALRARLVTNGRERVRRRHDPVRTFAAFRELYEVAAA
jgi:glycosyltransferase involved in cell wall biosynthesis